MTFHRSIKLTGVLIGALTLSSCETLKVLTFNDDDRSGYSENESVSLFLYRAALNRDPDERNLRKRQILNSMVKNLYETHEDLQQDLKDCGYVPKRQGGIQSGQLILGMVYFAVQHLFNYGAEKLQGYVESHHKKGLSAYSARLVGTELDVAATFGNACLFMQRSYKRDQNFLMILKLEFHSRAITSLSIDYSRTETKKTTTKKSEQYVEGKTSVTKEIIKTIVETAPLPTIEKSKEIPIAFTIRPIFIRVNKARALTEKDKPIELAVAVVGKNVIEENGALKSSDFVSTSFSISDIHLEKNITSLPQSSGLLVYPSEGSLVTEIDVSVVETGTAAGDTDKANAEILALKQIISSEAKKYLDERFKDTPK